jgi:transcriptional regulator GlxA family with amidase domain
VPKKKGTMSSAADSIADGMVPELFTLGQWRVLASQTGYDVCRLAALPDISRCVRSLERLFRRNFGATPSHYLKLWRAEDACHYIASTGAGNKQAAAKFGFYDEAHLCHVVKQMLARTPQSYFPCSTKVKTFTKP